MPRLATYLGHVSTAETYWYIQAVPELLRLATERIETVTGGVGRPRQCQGDNGGENNEESVGFHERFQGASLEDSFNESECGMRLDGLAMGFPTRGL